MVPKPMGSADFTEFADGQPQARGARTLLSAFSEGPGFGTTNRTKGAGKKDAAQHVLGRAPLRRRRGFPQPVLNR